MLISLNAFPPSKAEFHCNYLLPTKFEREQHKMQCRSKKLALRPWKNFSVGRFRGGSLLIFDRDYYNTLLHRGRNIGKFNRSSSENNEVDIWHLCATNGKIALPYTTTLSTNKLSTYSDKIRTGMLAYKSLFLASILSIVKWKDERCRATKKTRSKLFCCSCCTICVRLCVAHTFH